jgi:hypothetical protein
MLFLLHINQYFCNAKVKNGFINKNVNFHGRIRTDPDLQHIKLIMNFCLFVEMAATLQSDI